MLPPLEGGRPAGRKVVNGGSRLASTENGATQSDGRRHESDAWRLSDVHHGQVGLLCCWGRLGGSPPGCGWSRKSPHGLTGGEQPSHRLEALNPSWGSLPTEWERPKGTGAGALARST